MKKKPKKTKRVVLGKGYPWFAGSFNGIFLCSKQIGCTNAKNVRFNLHDLHNGLKITLIAEYNE